MAINKNFVIKNGAEVNTKLLVADAVTQKVGIGTTVPTYSLHVFGPNEQPGSIGASVVNVTGVTTTNLLTVGAAATFSVGPVFIGVGQSTGTPLQPLQVGSATTVKGVYISGDVGIGATFPGAKLEIVPESTRIAGLFTGSTSDDMVRITQTGSGNALAIEDASNPDATPFIVNASGDTGIGTDAARAKLHVLPTEDGIAGLFSGSTSNDMVRITQWGEGNALVVEDVVGDGTPFVIKATGDTGIGIGSDPIGAKLHVVPSTPGIGGMFTGATAGDMVRITQTGAGNALVVEDEANPDSTPFVIKASGDTGIGTNTPGAKLHVTPTATAAAGIFSGTTSADMVRITQTGSGNALVVEDEANEDATSFVISGLGSVGIGTNVPRYLLDIDGTKFASEGIAVGQTAVYIRGDVKIVGDLSADDITLDQIVNNYLNVSGFGTITDLLVPETASINIGIITNIQGGNLTLAGITSFLNAPGISTLTYIAGQSAAYTGISTFGRITGEDINLTGIATVARLNAPGISTIGFLQNTTLNVSGFSTLGGATATLLSVSGVSTLSGGVNAPQGINVDTNGINVAGISTLGSVTATELKVAGISTLGSATATELKVTGITTLGDATATTAVVTGFSTLGGASATLLNVSGITTISGGFEANEGINAARLNVSGISTLGSVTATEAVVTGISTLGQVSATGVSNTGVTTSNSYTIDGTTIVNSSRELQNIASLDATTTATIEAAIANAPNEQTDLFVTGISTLGQTTAEGLVVSGFSTLGATSASLLSVTGISTIGNLLVTPDASGIGATVGASVGIITYYGDGSNLTGVSIGIQSGGFLVGYGVTTLNFIGAGNTFLYNSTTNTVDISIQGGGGAGFSTHVAGIATVSSVGVNTSNLDDPDLTGIGNSFKGLYIGNGMLIVDNALNGDHYIGTNFNGLMAGPVTINGTLTIDGNWVVV